MAPSPRASLTKNYILKEIPTLCTIAVQKNNKVKLKHMEAES